MNEFVPPDDPTSAFSEFCVSWTVIILATLIAGAMSVATGFYQPVQRYLRTHHSRGAELRAV